jgi:23S rRNA A1618 N6-methylase RlmF
MEVERAQIRYYAGERGIKGRYTFPVCDPAFHELLQDFRRFGFVYFHRKWHAVETELSKHVEPGSEPFTDALHSYAFNRISIIR